MHDEVAAANSVEDIIRSHPSFINVAVHYLRPKQTPYIRETLQGVIREVINADDLDLETDPCVVSDIHLANRTCHSLVGSDIPRTN